MDYSKIYRPLVRSKREIRLLRVRPRCDGKITLSLLACSLISEPAYVAVSYCWTERPRTQKILLEGCPFFVRPNLYDYLEVLSAEQESSLIFIDALCINQTDEEEIVAQIRLMRTIYSNSREVVAWMGMGSPDDSITDAEMPRLERACANEGFLMEVFKGKSEDFLYLKVAFFCTFLKYEYWSRLWIVQQTILARSLVLRFRTLRFRAELLDSVIRQHNSLDMLEVTSR